MAIITRFKSHKRLLASYEALQSGLPNSAVVPRDWLLILIDLKYCFLIISLFSMGRPAWLVTWGWAYARILTDNGSTRWLVSRNVHPWQEAWPVVETALPVSPINSGFRRINLSNSLILGDLPACQGTCILLTLTRLLLQKQKGGTDKDYTEVALSRV